MEVKTKYNVGDTLYTVDRETMRMYSGKVEVVYVAENKTQRVIQYNVKLENGLMRMFEEERSFSSEVELKNYMFS